MPQAIPAIAHVVATYLGVGIVGEIIIVAALTLVAKSLIKQPGRGDFPINVTIRSSVAERRLVLGKVRAGGVLLFAKTSGSKNKYLWYVIAYAGHQCNDIQDCWLDKYKIPDADINGSTGAVSTSRFDGKLKIWDHLGTQAQTVDSNLDSEFTEWTSNHRLRGITYSAYRFERNDSAFPTGAPQSCTRLIEGAKLYDPRLDSTNGGSGSHRSDDPSTWAYSNNWALAVRWFLSGGSVVNDQSSRLVRYGLQEDDSRIDDAYVIAAANIADQSVSGANAPPSGAQNRYEIGIELSCSQTRRDILEHLLAAAAGQLVYCHGKWRLYAAAYDSPAHTFTQDDLFVPEGDEGTAPIEIEDTTGDEERVNQLSAIFIDASQDYTEQTTTVRTDAAYVTQDNDREIPEVIELRGVTDQYRAQRVCEINLRRRRQMRTVKFRFGRQGLKIAPWETFSMSHTRYGWSSRVFRCVKREPVFAGRGSMIVEITAKQESSSIYTDLLTADYTSGTSITNALQSDDIETPTGLTATVRTGAIEFTWSVSDFWRNNGVSELWESTSNDFSTASKIWEGRATRAVIEKTDTTSRYYWVRISTISGKTSDTEPGTTSGLAAAAYYAVIAPSVSDQPSDGNIAYTSGTQPRVEASGIGSHITYTSPSGVATRCIVNYSGQADVSNTTSGTATGYASISVTVQVNSSTVFTREARLEAVLNGSDAWATLAGSKAFDVPAGQAIDVFLNTGRTFSTGGSSPAQTIYHRACHIEILPTKQT